MVYSDENSKNVKIKYKKLYGVFDGMKQRCKNPNRKDFSRYGGRGISFDPKWRTFAGFFKDMGYTYKNGLTLDRIDNNKGYFKENCRWVTQKEQANNRKNNVKVIYNGIMLNSSQWAEKLGIKKTTFQYRKTMGWNLDRLMNSDLRPKQ
jgi:hypothetical protein